MHFTVDVSCLRILMLSLLAFCHLSGCNVTSELEIRAPQTDAGDDLNRGQDREDLGISTDAASTDANQISEATCTPAMRFESAYLTVSIAGKSD